VLKIHDKKLGKVTFLCLQGRIVTGETEALRNAVNSQSELRTLILDFTRVSTIDAGGLGVLLALREQTQAKGIEFCLVNLSEPVERILKITRLNSVFEISSTAGVFRRRLPGQPVSVAALAPCV
jgi:anti-anti-sigma factor